MFLRGGIFKYSIKLMEYHLPNLDVCCLMPHPRCQSVFRHISGSPPSLPQTPLLANITPSPSGIVPRLFRFLSCAGVVLAVDS